MTSDEKNAKFRCDQSKNHKTVKLKHNGPPSDSYSIYFHGECFAYGLDAKEAILAHQMVSLCGEHFQRHQSKKKG